MPPKPNLQPGWKDLPSDDKDEQKKLYRKELKEYKNSLRSNRIRPPSSLPESIIPCYKAIGNPYLNILAFSLYDIREDILESLIEHPEVILEDEEF